MRAAWLVLLLAALVVLVGAVWLGSVVYWANQHGPGQRALYRDMVRTHGLDGSERDEVQNALRRGAALENPRLRRAVVDWARRALARDVELRAEHPWGSVAVVVLYAVAAGCAVAGVALLLLDGHVGWWTRLTFTFYPAWGIQFPARPFLRRRKWRQAIERNSAGAPT